MKKICLWLLLPIASLGKAQQPQNEYGLTIIHSLAQFPDTANDRELVRIKDYVPDIVADIKYATNQNVFYEKLYDKPYMLLRKPAAIALAKVQADLKAHGAGLKIFDAYRPYSVTCYMFQRIPDTIYMGKPWKGSKHNRGIAIDVTLIDIKTKKERQMPTPYDCLTYPAHPGFMELPDTIIRNRSLLIETMKKYGFTVARNEWWHFDFTDNHTYELLDIPSVELEKLAKKRWKKSRRLKGRKK